MSLGNLDIEFHAPFRTSVADSSQEFRDKYFAGDWMGERSKLAHRGIRFVVVDGVYAIPGESSMSVLLLNYRS
jgi:hypothetical protein